MDEDELEDYFIIERDSGEPSSEGQLTHPVQLQQVSPELEQQTKAFLKHLDKLKVHRIPNKRKRDTIYEMLIAKVISAKLLQYPTTVREDEELLQKDNLSKRHRMAIQVRLGEKSIIHEAIDLISKGDGDMNEPNGERVTKRAKH